MARGVGIRTRLALSAVTATVAALVLVAPAGGAVATFGADLVGPADNPATCATANWGAAGPQPSCTFYSGAPGPTFYAPASGTVTTVRVKTGPSTGPMQIIVLYSLYQNNVNDPGHPYFACCFIAQYGPTFTPNANDVTQLATSLSMVEQPTPPPNDGTSIAEGDFLAISILDSNTAIPATSDNGSFFTGFAPAPDPGSAPPRGPNPPPVSATTGGNTAHIAMNADIDTGGNAAAGGGAGKPPPTFTPPGAPAAPGAHPVLRPVTINPAGGQFRGNTASIPLTCALPSACNGTLTLTPPGVHAAAKKKTKAKKTKSYGSTSFSIPAGKTQAVKVKLNATGRRKSRGHRSLRVTATATVGTQAVSGTLTLKRAGKHAKKKKKKNK